MPIRQSFCYPMFHKAGTPFADFCKAAKGVGIDAVELWNREGNYNGVTFEEIVEAARSSDLAVASMCGHGTLGDGLNNPANHERIEAELRVSIDLAAKHRIPGLICFSGNRNKGQTDYEGAVTCAKGLRRVARYAQDKGVNLNVELLNSRVDHPGYQADHTDWGIALCEMVQSPRVKLLFDIYHMQIMEGDVIRWIQSSAGYVGHFHTAGNPGRRDFDDTQEMNYRGICKAVAATGYDGYLGHEFSPKGDPIKALAEAVKICTV